MDMVTSLRLNVIFWNVIGIGDIKYCFHIYSFKLFLVKLVAQISV